MTIRREKLWEDLAKIIQDYAQACVDYGESNGGEDCKEYRAMERHHDKLCTHLETMQTELQ